MDDDLICTDPLQSYVIIWKEKVAQKVFYVLSNTFYMEKIMNLNTFIKPETGSKEMANS